MGKFDDLYINIDDEIIKIMKNILKNVLFIDPINKRLIARKIFNCKKFSVKEKILVIAIGFKAMSIDGIDSEVFTPKKISDQFGINYNTIRVQIRKLLKEGYLLQEKKGAYKINISRIHDIKDLLSNIKKECGE